MKINIGKRKLIKPITPTPQNLKNFKISFIDEIAPSENIAILLFYPSKPDRFQHKLEESLRKILPQFYVFAGRYIKSDFSVSCNDEGAELVKAEAVPDEHNNNNDNNNENDLIPRSPFQMDEATDPLLSIQITDLSVGGLAIGVSLSHRVADASTLATFVAAWTNSTTTGEGNVAVVPNFEESPAFFPGRRRGHPYLEPSGIEGPVMERKKLHFDEEAVAGLRSRLGCSKVVAASTVVAKALIGLDRTKQGRSRDCYIAHAVNIRGRIVPSLGRHACGNLALHSLGLHTGSAISADDAGSMQHLVDLMRNAIGEVVSDCAWMMPGGGDRVSSVITRAMDNALPRILSGEAHGAWFIDWSKFGFYEADFGWGKRVRTSIGPQQQPALTVLMETGDGKGIEAWVYLSESDMVLFEQDQDIRLFAI